MAVSLVDHPAVILRSIECFYGVTDATLEPRAHNAPSLVSLGDAIGHASDQPLPNGSHDQRRSP